MIVDTEKKAQLIRSSEIDLFTGKDLKRPEVFSRLYRQYYDDIFMYCVHRLFDRISAEDVTSDVFFKVVENIDGFKGTQIQFRNWTYKIATNSINEHLRRKLRRESAIKVIGETSSSEASQNCSITANEKNRKVQSLKWAIYELKPRYQTIITLRFFENLKLTEIAEILSSKEGTVRSQLSRALKQLKRKLAFIGKEV